MKKHKRSKHEGIKYPCDQCEYASTSTTNSKQHKESKHEGKRYSYDQCEFITLAVVPKFVPVLCQKNLTAETFENVMLFARNCAKQYDISRNLLTKLMVTLCPLTLLLLSPAL